MRWSDEPTHILHTRFNAATLRNNTLPSYKNCPSTHSSPNDVSSPAHCEDGFADMHFLHWCGSSKPLPEVYATMRKSSEDVKKGRRNKETKRQGRKPRVQKFTEVSGHSRATEPRADVGDVALSQKKKKTLYCFELVSAPNAPTPEISACVPRARSGRVPRRPVSDAEAKSSRLM